MREQKHYKTPWIKYRLCARPDMNQTEPGQKINNLITLPGSGGCDDVGGQQSFVKKALTWILCVKTAALLIRQIQLILKRINKVLWMRLCKIWSKHNEHNSAAKSLGIWSKDVMQPSWAGRDNLHHTHSLTPPLPLYLSVTSWWKWKCSGPLLQEKCPHNNVDILQVQSQVVLTGKCTLKYSLSRKMDHRKEEYTLLLHKFIFTSL